MSLEAEMAMGRILSWSRHGTRSRANPRDPFATSVRSCICVVVSQFVVTCYKSNRDLKQRPRPNTAASLKEEPRRHRAVVIQPPPVTHAACPVEVGVTGPGS